MKQWMKPRTILAFLTWIPSIGFGNATEDDYELSFDQTTQTFQYKWLTQSGRSYFIQTSENLVDWTYLPEIVAGDDDWSEWGFSVNSKTFFVRLRYSDIAAPDVHVADFDGDDIGNMDELLQESDPLSVLDLNGNGVPDDWELFWDDQFGVFPKPISVSLTYRESSTQPLYLNNPVAPDADFSISLTGSHAQFQGPYVVEDSMTGNVMYNWTDIRATGTKLPSVSEVDNGLERLSLTQFEFPHYGRMYTEIWVSSNGYLSLKKEFNDPSNEELPDPSFPDGLIAVFWDDLDTKESGNDGGTIFYQEYADRLIVQFEAVTQDSNAFTNTFQVVLHSDGTIEYFYKDLNGVLDTVTVGTHNFDQSEGVEVVYNETYLQDLLAIRFSQETVNFVEVTPVTGTVMEGGLENLSVDFETFELSPGTYEASIEISHSGAGSTPWIIPAVLHLTNPPSQIEMTFPIDGFSMWEDESVILRATGTDDDFGIERVEFYADATQLGEDLVGSTYTTPWAQPAPGVYSLSARAVDRLGAVTVSDPVTVAVLADADLDRMEDDWESLYFAGLQEDPLGDYDQDGASNLHEYEAGTDPTDSNDTPVNVPSVVLFTGPVDGATYLQGDDIRFYASFDDPDFGAREWSFVQTGSSLIQPVVLVRLCRIVETGRTQRPGSMS